MDGTEVVMVQVLNALTAAESTTFAAKGVRPSVVGVPLTTPVEGVRLSPGGRDPVIENV